MQIIDTSFQIQKAEERKIVAGIATLSVEELDDPERLAAYLATVCSLPEEDCLVALKECEKLAVREAPLAASTQHRLAQGKQKLQSEWVEWRGRLRELLKNIQGPQDYDSYLQAEEFLAALTEIAARLNELG